MSGPSWRDGMVLVGFTSRLTLRSVTIWLSEEECLKTLRSLSADAAELSVYLGWDDPAWTWAAPSALGRAA